ncbi:MAG: ribosome recycling factor [Epsilonproteobacteria bacterium]|nr:ribosome recycling factor [Campylobacterota bacterium]
MKEIAFSEGDNKSFEKLLRTDMEKPVEHFKKELASLRTGRATIALLENIRVECYGQLMTLREVATLGAPESRLLTIQPWDKSIIGEIEKAIATSDLGAAPINDGELVRIQLPQMSASRRDELVKLVGKKTEEAKIGIRNVRKEFHNELRDAEKKRIISEDFAKKLSELLQKVTDEFIKTIDGIHDKKEAEIKTV